MIVRCRAIISQSEADAGNDGKIAGGDSAGRATAAALYSRRESAGKERKGRKNRAAPTDCDPTCTIDGQDYPNGAPNLGNPCEVCDSAWDPLAWSHAPSLSKCGVNLDQICCNGVCCPDRPGCRGCTIGGRFYFDGQRNPDDPCQQCVTAGSTTSWSNALNANVREAIIDEDGVW